MSVQKTHYVIWGIKFKPDSQEVIEYLGFDTDDDKIEEYYNTAFDNIISKNDISIIQDGMNGEYIIVGYIMNKSKAYGDLNDFTKPFKTKEEVEDPLFKEFNIFKSVELICITHYS